MGKLDLGKPVGPLPLGAWIIVVGAGVGIALYARKGGSGGFIEDTSMDPGVGTGPGWTAIYPPTSAPNIPGTNDPAPQTPQEPQVIMPDWSGFQNLLDQLRNSLPTPPQDEPLPPAPQPPGNTPTTGGNDIWITPSVSIPVPTAENSYPLGTTPYTGSVPLPNTIYYKDPIIVPTTGGANTADDTIVGVKKNGIPVFG
jgi:hypothetical protein